VKKYLNNCFLLIIPILIWNVILTNKLPKAFQPEIFWKDIPSILSYGENISRTIVFVSTLLMPLNISTHIQKKGLVTYGVGTLFYFISWLPLIYLPLSKWSNAIAGFMAPSYTPFIWLVGIGLMGDSYYFNLPHRRWLFVLAITIFLSFHNIHTYIIYCRTH
jgi:hypothetical protein